MRTLGKLELMENAAPATEPEPEVSTEEPEFPEHDPSKIKLEDCDFFYGDFKALKGVSFDIPEKEVTAAGTG